MQIKRRLFCVWLLCFSRRGNHLKSIISVLNELLISFLFWLCQLKSWIERNRVWIFNKQFCKICLNPKGVHCSTNLASWSITYQLYCYCVCVCVHMHVSLLLDRELVEGGIIGCSPWGVPVYSLVQLWWISQKKHMSSYFHGQEGCIGTGKERQLDQI